MKSRFCDDEHTRHDHDHGKARVQVWRFVKDCDGSDRCEQRCSATRQWIHHGKIRPAITRLENDKIKKPKPSTDKTNCDHICSPIESVNVSDDKGKKYTCRTGI